MLKESHIANTLSHFISFSVFEKNVKRFTSRMSSLVPLTKASKKNSTEQTGLHLSSVSNIVSETPTSPAYIIQLLESCSAMALPSAFA